MRTFVAVEISCKDVLESIKKIQSSLKINAKPIEPQNMHFTLQFLGEVSDSMLGNIQDALSSVEFEPFDVSFESIGVFPKPRFARIIWVGVDKDGTEYLTNLARKVTMVLSPLGFSPDKPFQPHVTIFRVKNKINDITDELTKIKDSSFGIQRVVDIKLKKSSLTSKGPVYSDLYVVKARQ
ncbi:MAG: RNA 2',3'-cyclic phosphodiesterase [Thaumarchaeota archaeon]|nr:RNA 2',3'-cyclic phosphodiesterase [Nitrososphaerota archaeon]